LTEADGFLLRTVAVLAGVSEGAYAAQVVARHVNARLGELPVAAREALGEVVGVRADVVGVAGEIAAIGRLLNQIARHVNVHGRLPAGSSLARIEREVDVAGMRLTATLAGLDEAAAALRERL
jgi:hypothetical protein